MRIAAQPAACQQCRSYGRMREFWLKVAVFPMSGFPEDRKSPCIFMDLSFMSSWNKCHFLYI